MPKTGYSRIQKEGGKSESQPEKSTGQLIKENLGPGITVALVSIPLSVALAIASGAAPMQGLSAAIYGPCVGGLVGGSNYNILGPAGALVNILNGLAVENGPEIIPWVAFFAGIFSLGIWFFQLQKYCTIIPNSVLEGFSFSVAITIGLGQLNFAMGLINPAPAKEFYMNVMWSLTNIPNLVMVEFAPFLIFFVMLFSLMKFLPGRPWIILIAVFGIIYGYSMDSSENMRPTLLKDKYPTMSEGATIVNWSFMSAKVSATAILIGSLKVAFVAVLETLISARIADNLTGTRFDSSKEVYGMALGNMLSGIMGGTPCTGVLVRTGVNVASGATDKISQFINAMTVLVIVLLFLPMFSYIPMPVIASMLMTSAFRLVPFKIINQLLEEDKPDFFILVFTTCVCIFGDGALGLLAGGFVALMRNAANNNTGNINFTQKDSTLTVELTGQLSYINALDVEIKVIDKIRDTKPDFVIIDLSALRYIDVDGLDSLKNIYKQKVTFGFTKMLGNEVFDKSEFVQLSDCFYEGLEEATQMTVKKGTQNSLNSINEGGSFELA